MNRFILLRPLHLYFILTTTKATTITSVIQTVNLVGDNRRKQGLLQSDVSGASPDKAKLIQFHSSISLIIFIVSLIVFGFLISTVFLLCWTVARRRKKEHIQKKGSLQSINSVDSLKESTSKQSSSTITLESSESYDSGPFMAVTVMKPSEEMRVRTIGSGGFDLLDDGDDESSSSKISGTSWKEMHKFHSPSKWSEAMRSKMK